jgi:hypothetical protein
METRTIDKLFLELSQFTQAKTGRELELEGELLAAEQRAQKWRDELSKQISSTERWLIDVVRRENREYLRSVMPRIADAIDILEVREAGERKDPTP